MKNKIAFYNRQAPHYRKGVYVEMEKELDCHFYFGNNRPGNIKKMDYKYLNNFICEFENVDLGNFYWQKGAIRHLLFKSYKFYITPGDFKCITNWILFPLLKLSNKRLYLWTHGLYGRESKTELFLKKIFYSFADGFYLYGEYAKEVMIQNGYDKEKLHVIYNSLDYDLQLSIRNRISSSDVYLKHFGNDNPVLIFIGRLTKTKNINLLLETQRILKDKNINVNLVVIGEGEERASLESEVIRLELKDEVWFLGAIYDEVVNSEYLYNADLCVSPGNVGLTAIHSLNYGTPVITHNNLPFQGPEFEAITEGETGSFFEYNNLISLVEKIDLWISNKNDRESIREKCYKVVDDKYNPSYQVSVIKKTIK